MDFHRQIDVTFSYHIYQNKVHYRVLASSAEDWSGWADSEEEAFREAMQIKAKIAKESGW